MADGETGALEGDGQYGVLHQHSPVAAGGSLHQALGGLADRCPAFWTRGLTLPINYTGPSSTPVLPHIPLPPLGGLTLVCGPGIVGVAALRRDPWPFLCVCDKLCSAGLRGFQPLAAPRQL